MTGVHKMVEIDILKYYYECLKLDSYYSTALRRNEYISSVIDPKDIDSIIIKYQELSKKLKSDQIIMLGFPILETKDKLGKTVYVPLLMWSIHVGENEFNIYRTESYSFNYYLYSFLRDIKLIESLNVIRDDLFSQLENCYNTPALLEGIYEIVDIDYKAVKNDMIMCVGSSTNFNNYHIVREIQDIVAGKQEMSLVTKGYLTHAMELGTEEQHQNLYHIVKSNYPQNNCLKNVKSTVNIIKGPPGTGKTQTILNLIANQVIKGKNCIISSTNNQPVDNIIEKFESNNIVSDFFGIIRFGNKDINKANISNIREDIKKIRSIQQEEISEHNYTTLLASSNALGEDIEVLEMEANGRIELLNNIIRLEEQIKLLNERITLDNLSGMKAIFKKSGIYGEKIEARLRDILDSPDNELYGTNLISKVIKFLCGRFKNYYRLRLKRLIKSLDNIDFLEVWTNIDLSTPIESLSYMEEVVKVLNLEARLDKYKVQLTQAESNDAKNDSKLKKLYEDKISVDRKLMKYIWLKNAKEILDNKESMQRINEFLTEMEREGIAKVNNSAFNLILKLFPVVMISNLSVRNCVPKSTMFDLAIVDESSQCSIPSIISLLQSSQKICMLGDENQLNHIASVDPKLSEKLFKENIKGLLFDKYCYHRCSAFDRAQKSVELIPEGTNLLSYHYRCIPSIIEHSNKGFYNNRLRIMRKEPERKEYKSGVFARNVYGYTKNKTNEAEIKEVTEIVSQLMCNGVKNIGIITPFSNQKKILINTFKARDNIKVGTIHTFQGGECEAIVLSTVISEGASSFQINFIQKDFRLINVALTRAKDYFILVGNLSKINTQNGFLSKLYNYILTIDSKGFQNPTIELSLEFNRVIMDGNRKKLMHEGELMVFNKLARIAENMPFVVYPKIPIKDTLIINLPKEQLHKKLYYTGHFDYVIYEKESLKPFCAIEYDGKCHGENNRAIENDEIKDNLCKLAGFTLLRIDTKDEEKGWQNIKAFFQSFC